MAAAADKRVFGEAGDFNEDPDEVVAGHTIPTGIGRALIHPKYLHSNATSHPWVFGAIAELFDNAIDEHDSTYVSCDDVDNPKTGEKMLVIQDDGGGMDPEGMHKMLSLGMCTKQGQNKIGQYGNGFKSGTMRIGSCVIIFTRSRKAGTRTIGLLSYRFLRMEQLQEVIVPMLSWDADNKPMDGGDKEQWEKNKELILKWSPFKDEQELEEQFPKKSPESNEYDYYTRIIIYNLWLDSGGRLELDFSTPNDICVRPTEDEMENIVNAELANKYRGYRLSLKKYLEVLYRNIKPQFHIFLRKKVIEPFRIENELIFTKTYDYIPRDEGKPKDQKPKKYKIIVGFVNEMERPELRKAKGMPMGFLVYNRQRLIQPYWEVFKNHSSHGKGVVGVIDVDFIKPSHNKQSFETGPALQKLAERLKKAVKDYWDENCPKVGYVSNRSKSKKKAKSKNEKEDEESDFVEVEKAPPTPPASLPNKDSPEQRKPENGGLKREKSQNPENWGSEEVARDAWAGEQHVWGGVGNARGEGMGNLENLGNLGNLGNFGNGGFDEWMDVEYGENGRPKRRPKPIDHFDPMPVPPAPAAKRPSTSSKNGAQPSAAKRQRLSQSSDDENRNEGGDSRVLDSLLEKERQRVRELQDMVVRLTREAEEARGLRDEHAQLRQDVESLTEKADYKEQKHKYYKDLSKRYRRKIEELEQIEAQLRVEIETLKSELQQLKLCSKMERSEIGDTKEKNAALQRENFILKSKVDEVTENIVRKTRQWNDEFYDIRKEADSWKAEAESWKRKYEDEKKQADYMRVNFGYLMQESGPSGGGACL